MEELGIVGPYEGAKPRAVVIDRSGWIEIQRQLGLISDEDADELLDSSAPFDLEPEDEY